MKYFFRIVFFVVIPLLFLSSCKGKKRPNPNHDNKQNVTVSSDTGVDLSSPLYLKAKKRFCSMLKKKKLATQSQNLLVLAGVNFSSLFLNFVGGMSEYNCSSTATIE